MTLRIHNTLSRATEIFTPIEPGHVRLYVCGITIYDYCHMGHARFLIAFDVVQRWLKALGLRVTYVRNVTDIDDKIIRRSLERNIPIRQLTDEMIAALHEDADKLFIERPTHEPRATQYVPQMLELIALLVERGHAYAAEDGSGDVYFDVQSWPSYGELTRQKVDDMEAAEDADPRGKRDPRDFALWKGHKESEPETASWAAPWGRGRPGWHIECSAMAEKYLGPSFDIHGGGVDLRFPHHENEQAQSRAAGHPFASYWMHNAWITTSGEKMSKSLGNSLVIPEVLKKVRGIELRFYMVGAHYRSHVEFSHQALEEAAVGWRRIENFLDRTAGPEPVVEPDSPVVEPVETWPQAFADAMDDDLGTPAAVAVLYDAVREGNRQLAAGESASATAGQVRAMLDVLGLDPADPGWPTGGGADTKLTTAVDVLVAALLERRTEARAAKDFAAADAIRDRIKAAGIEIEDTPDGPKWSI